ncbi:bifunctional 2-polyprenyl-6-hydroxyphenol methylase/3-demethylubiquinol 3-O-methyltransferase UbiG [Patulibacter sp.]|uniref:class I SAM-dependent methyltransferase n=1 Tax=Patulibacter sp. TaxID=1912859 RepID=UPI002716041B|nr:class I SAM-dependent methyltransferase [Patulibacter sp.]MDO9409775.1 class I SAM-dependent methyltransferase [Patulibacter sp.]
MSSAEPPLVRLPAGDPSTGGSHRSGEDPRGPSSPPPHEREKHDRTVAACGPGRFSGVLVLGTGNGALPWLLADRSDDLLAIDPSTTAVALALERLPDAPHVTVTHGDLPDALPRAGGFDLVVVSDVLCRLPVDALRRTIDRLPRLMRPGARVVAVHWDGHAPDLTRTATEAHRALRAGTGLRPAQPAPPASTRGHLLEAFDMR